MNTPQCKKSQYQNYYKTHYTSIKISIYESTLMKNPRIAIEATKQREIEHMLVRDSDT
jgi:hypothetical protein